MINLIKYKNIFVGVSGILVLASFVCIWVFGFSAGGGPVSGWKLGIDISGGTLWQVKLAEAVLPAELEEYLKSEFGLESVSITTDSTGETFYIRIREISENEHQDYLTSVEEKFDGVEELRFESIGPAIGKELRDKALWAFVLVLIGISLYIAFAFRKISYLISSWKYGMITLVTLFHDALIPAGIFSVLGLWKPIEIDTNFIVAILVIIGFSVHDTIVVFDRIRENLLVFKNKKNFDEVVNISVNQTIARSINTSLTLIFVLVALYFFGATSLSYFTLLILIGTIIGTYSSIFVASPLLVLIKPKGLS